LELVEQGAKDNADCEECEKPKSIPGNEDVFLVHSYNPFQIHFGGVLIDAGIALKIMDMLEIDDNFERKMILDRLIYYNYELYKKNDTNSKG
jgi:hypothetical protein